jgi:hypothetical protein
VELTEGSTGGYADGVPAGSSKDAGVVAVTVAS